MLEIFTFTQLTWYTKSMLVTGNEKVVQLSADWVHIHIL